VAAFTVAFFVSTASARPPCIDRSVVIERLEQRYQEKSVSLGIAENGHVVEVLTSPTGTWTIIITAPGGKTCFIASGNHWMNIKQVKGQKL